MFAARSCDTHLNVCVLAFVRPRVYFSVVMIGFRAFAKEHPDKTYFGGLDGEALYNLLSNGYAKIVVGLPNLFCFLCWFLSFSWIFGIVFFAPIAIGHVLYIWALLFAPYFGLEQIRKKAANCREWADGDVRNGKKGTEKDAASGELDTASGELDAEEPTATKSSEATTYRGHYQWLKIPKFWEHEKWGGFKKNRTEIGEIDLYKLPFQTLEDTLWWLEEDMQKKGREFRIQCAS